MTTNTVSNTVQDYKTSAIPDITCPSVQAVNLPADVSNCQSLMEQLERSLQSARTSDEMKEVRDRAAAMQHYFRSVKAGQQEQNRAAAVKIRAERRLGEELSRLEKAKGGGDQRSDHRSHDVTGGLPTLADLGITKAQSSRWQALASIPEDDFERYIAKVIDSGEDLTTAGVMRHFKRQHNDAQRTRKPATIDPADNDSSATDGEEVGTVAEIVNSIAGMSTAEPSCADAMTEPGDPASVEKLEELSETPEPEEHDDAVQGAAQAGRDGLQQVATPVELGIYPDSDPYSDREPLWVRGALQSIGPLAQELSTLADIPNRNLLTGLLLQLFAALAPACLENPIPEEKRGRIVSLLRYCRYRDFADQLLDCWAKADDANARSQLDMFPHQSFGDKRDGQFNMRAR
jgi:hypothetical protein